ncbi:MAG: MYG1 family protein [Candidatus Paceibacterota bacterium]|jgi:uncharacterized UPF0160 family protein
MSHVQKATIVVHNGRFHTDDVFATAIIEILLKRRGLFELEQPTIVRTRDENIIREAEYVMDVGGVYDADSRRFDHHQKGGAGVRANGIPYASFGLVWKTYGVELAGSEKVAQVIDERLVQAIDANDNGVSVYKPLFEKVYPYGIYDGVSSLNPTWKEGEDDRDVGFFKAVAAAEVIVEREIAWARDIEEARSAVEKLYATSFDKRICVFDKPYPSHVLTQYPEVLYAIKPNVHVAGGTWKVEAIAAEENSYTSRKPFPSIWAGKRDQELAQVTGVADAVFCHNGRFLLTAGSQESALKLALLAADFKEENL